MSGILYVVATPIGNLEDVTLRALRVLREVSVIAAEDTRRTARLLQHYSISTPTTSLHEHNEHTKAARIIERLQVGESVAVVSDAGTPVISDPGSRLVTAAHEAGITVQPVPGPSAVTALVSGAGIAPDGFTFVGFPPNRSNARKRWLQSFASHPFPLILYEAPHRIHALLADVSGELGERRVAIGRELTKLHENLAIRPISKWLSDLPLPQGEFSLLIFPDEGKGAAGEAGTPPAVLAAEFRRLTNNSELGRREALREVAARFGVRTKDVFNAVEAHVKSGE